MSSIKYARVLLHYPNCLGHFRSFYKILWDKMNGSIFTFKGLKEILGGQKKVSLLNYQRWFCSRILSWWTVFCFEFNLWVVLIVTLAKKRCPTGRDCALIMKLGMIRNIFRKFEIIKVTDAICILTAQSWKVCLKWWYTQLRLSISSSARAT